MNEIIELFARFNDYVVSIMMTTMALEDSGVSTKIGRFLVVVEVVASLRRCSNMTLSSKLKLEVSPCDAKKGMKKETNSQKMR